MRKKGNDTPSLTYADKRGAIFMRNYRKTYVWILGGIGVFLVIFMILVLLAPMLINSKLFKEKIAAEISEKIGAHLEAQRIDLLFFPYPHLVINQGRVSIPDKISGAFRSLAIYPEFLQLLVGSVEVGRLVVESPEAQIKLPGELKGEKERLKTFSLENVEKEIGSFLGEAISKAPGLVVVVEKGQLNIVKREQSLWRFHDIHAQIGLGPKRATVEISCKSNLWENFSLEGWLIPEGFKGQGHLELKRFHPQAATGYLFPLITPRIKDSQADLTLRFKVSGSKVFQIDVRGSIPSLTIQKGDERRTIKNTRLRGTFHLEGRKMTFSLSELDMSYPQLRLSGRLSIDPSRSLASLEINSKGMDVAALRETILFLIEKRIPLAQTVFGILKGGDIQWMRFQARGPSIDELGRENNFTIRGSIVGGKVFVPAGGFNLEEVKGNAVISRGFLEGEFLEARLGNSRGMNGSLRLGLKGERAPLHLDIIIKADLSQLPPYLREFLKDEAIRREVTLIREIRGAAVGRLILDQGVEGTNVKVAVSDVNLHGVYQRLPYPVEIQAGKVSINTAEAKIDLTNLRGKFRTSTFSQLTAEIAWGKETSLDVAYIKSKIVLEEIDSWLASLEGLKAVREKLRLTKGTVILDGELEGPISQPKRWHFRLKGEVENVSMESAALPGVADVATGKFEAIPERLTLTDIHVGALDTVLIVSGILDHFLEELDRVDLTLQGEIGQEGIQRIYDFISLPSEVRIRAPVSFSKAHLLWEKKSLTSFSGNFNVKQGPKVSVDLIHHPEELLINHLDVQDETSNASIALHQKEKEFDLSFSGGLTKATLDGLLMKNRFLSGWIKGEFRTQILLDQPMRSTAQGHLEAAGFDYPWRGEEPLRIESLSLGIERNRVIVKAARLSWGKSPLTLSGEVNFQSEAFFLNMDLSVEHLDLDEFLKKVPGKKGGKGGQNFWGVPLKGTLRFKTDYLKYGGYVWRPVHAEITLNPGKMNIAVTKANLCGIATPGVLEVFSEEFRFHFQAAAKEQPLAPALTCLWNEREIQGQFDVEAEIAAGGKREELARSLRGNLHFLAKDGRIYRFELLAKIFALLNVTEILRGKVPDLAKEGFAYHAMEMKGRLQDGKLIFEEAVIDGSSTDIVCKGSIDPIGNKIDLTVLVAPFKTFDRIIRAIPLVRYLLGGKLISIPVRVTGDLEDPTVIPFSASAVGSELIGMMDRVLHLPFKIIQPLIPEKQGKEP
jgi:hypothetical protein